MFLSPLKQLLSVILWVLSGKTNILGFFSAEQVSQEAEHCWRQKCAQPALLPPSLLPVIKINAVNVNSLIKLKQSPTAAGDSREVTLHTRDTTALPELPV